MIKGRKLENFLKRVFGDEKGEREASYSRKGRKEILRKQKNEVAREDFNVEIKRVESEE